MKTLLRAVSSVVLVTYIALAPLLTATDLRLASPAVVSGGTVRPANGAAEQPQVVFALPVAGAASTAFQFVLDAAPETISRAFVVYELTGVQHWTAAARSINGLPTRGGFGAVPSSGVALQVEEINPRWLRAGANQILFSPARGGGTAPSRLMNLDRTDVFAPAELEHAVPYAVSNLRLVYVDGTPEPTPTLRLSHPADGETDAAATILRGFVDPAALPNGPAELFVNETYVPQGIQQADGSFAVFVPRTTREGEPWDARIEVVYPDGKRLRHTVRLAGETRAEEEDHSDDSDELDAGPETAESLDVDEARLDVHPGALGGKVRLTMRRMRREELPAMDAGMTNVTPRRAGFRMGPHGLRFRKAVELSLPYDPALIPAGMTVDDVRTFFFDEAAGRWMPVPRVTAKLDKELIVSTTDHFTDFVNATLALPDAPMGASFSPNSLQELVKPDPASEVVQIEAPDAGPTGDAILDFPLVIPPGRHGMQPDLTVRYDSGAGNGWLGVGWHLHLPSIEVSTLFGVPRYDGTERYTIDGAQLTATSTPGTYVRRAEGSFERIVRHGSGAADYWWEVTDKNGRRAVYGNSAQARLSDPQNGNTFRWYLEREIDLHGNTVDYTYTTDRGTNGQPWVEVYPARIDYTGVNGTGAYYQVRFTLDGGSRDDRLSSGRPGFKTYTRHRLAQVDVLAGSAIVRRYAFAYREGGFQKSVLASIAVSGKGAAAEFHRHTFDYVPMAAAGDGFAGFAAQQAWGGMRGGKNFTEGTRAGGGAHGFVGLGPVGCQPHAGVQLGGSGTDSTQRVSFLDVNGDGLPDRLDASGGVDLNEYDPVADRDGTRAGEFGSRQFANADTLGHTSEWSLDFGMGLHAEMGITASLDASWVWSHANDDRLVADLNGDMRPDIVTTDGGFRVRVNDGTSFSQPTNWSGFTAAGLNLAAPGEGEVLRSFPLSHALRQLVLPFAGRVTVAGAVQKQDGSGDGVEAAIHHNGTTVWSRRFAANDTAPCTPGPNNSCAGGLTVDARAGDSLYFLAGSIRETSADALAWAPSVSYDGQDLQAREPYGARTFVFDARDDFSLAGYRGAAWSAAANGTVRIAGALMKQETSDDVTLVVAKNALPLFVKNFAAAEQMTFDGFPSITVAAGDRLSLTISSRTPIDARRIQWTPSVGYDGATEPTLSDELRTQRARVSIAIPELLPSHVPTKSWTATATGAQTFSVTCSDSTNGTLYVQGVNRLLATRALPVKDAFDVTVATTAGEPLFFSVVGDGSGSCKVADGAIPVNMRRQPDDATARVLSGGHHGWYYGEWNGNVAFTPAGLIPPKSEDDEDPDFVPATPRWEGTKGFAAPAWTAAGFDLYHAAEGMKPSRKGANAAAVLDQASGTSGGGLSVLRKTSTRTAGVSASAGVGISVSAGESDTTLDLLDMNGDRYPDQVSSGGVRFSNGRSGFDATAASFPGLSGAVRKSEDGNVSTSVGIGINFTRKNGKGKAASVLSTLPSVGSTVSLSHTTDDLVDVNGDGLPDRVSMSPGSDRVSVQLNLGYRFGAAEPWELPALDARASSGCKDVVDYVGSSLGTVSGLDTLNGLSFTRSSALSAGVAIGPFGGGVSTTLARTLVELVDVNGDGLPDRVAKEQGDDFFRVQLNLGDRWDREQRWYAPRWSTSIGDGYNPGNVFQCLDAVAFSGNVDVNGSVGAPVCIPLVPPVPVVGLQIEVSAQGFGTTSNGLQLFLDDIDGDGLADHILKKAGDGNVYVRRNQAGRVNLLSAVHRPLGSTIALAYERRGNTPNMPFSQWVLSDVKISDGRGSAPQVTKINYGNDAVYDRVERESYGYARVRVTRPDGSTVERDFLNRNLYTRHLQTRQALADAAGKLFRVDVTRYEELPVSGANAARFPARMEETTSFYEGTTSVATNAPKETRRIFDYDAQGNVRGTTDYADSGAEDDVRTTIAYQIDPATRLTRPVGVEVRDGAGRLLRKRQGTFNSSGELLALEQTLEGGRDPQSGFAYSGAKAVWNRTYDALGNLTSSTDPSGFTSTFTYETSAHTYPVEVRDSFGYVTRYAYDLDHGQLAETTDQNGNTLHRVYDAFGRLSRVVGPYDTDAAPTLSFEYRLGAPLSWAVARHKDATRADTIDSSVFVDSLGRVVQTKEDAELDQGIGNATRTGMRVSGRVEYDALNRVVSEAQPTFDDRAVDQFVDAPAKNPTTFTYDVLDRVRSARFPHGATTKASYELGTLDGVRRFLTVRTDPQGRVTRFYRDVQDNVLGVEQTNTIAGARKALVTRYTYDALDQLVAVIDAKGNATRLEYDTLGRNTVVDNPDAGRTELRFDPAGNLRAKVTPNLAAANQQIRYLYTYNRLDRVDNPQSPDVVYTYGAPRAPSNRANRVATVADESGVEERSYGKLGEVVQSVKTTAALNGTTPKGPFTTRFQFDSFERLLSVVYPDGETLTYGYDAGGNVKSAAGVLKGARFDYLRHVGYDELGERTRVVYGNGIETRYTFDPKSRLLAQLRTTAGSRDLQNLKYQHDAGGTVLAMQNDVPVPASSLYGGPVTQTFRYDDLAQLVGAQGTYTYAPNKVSAYTLALTYDELGNTVAKNQLHQTGSGAKLNPEKKTTYNAAYTYAGPQPRAATRIGERTFRYDANGNQIGWESDGNGTRRTLTWNEANRLTSVADNGQTTRFLYDADGTRTNKAGPHGETTYVNRWFSLRNGAVASKHVFADEVRVASKVSPDPEPPSEKVYFFQGDHLGSTNFVTDETGLVFQHLEYFPSGEIWVDERSETQRTPHLFSGKELDEETGLSYFGYRYYEARQGQWISADPILDELLDVGTLTPPTDTPLAFHLSGHVYGYVGNDPLNHVDPNGLVKLAIAKQGKAFENKVKRRLLAMQKKKLIKSFRMQVRARAAGVTTVLDYVVLDKKNRRRILEAKSSETAPLTKNQARAFPVIKATGFTESTTGAVFGPTQYSIVRPKTLKKGVLERMLK